MKILNPFVLISTFWLAASPVLAWDPNEGADPLPHRTPAATTNALRFDAPRPLIMAPAPAPLPTQTVSVPPPVAAVAPPPPPPVLVPPAPLATTPAQAGPAFVMTPQGVVSTGPETIKAPTLQTNRFALGVEGFYDRYQEPVVDLDSRAVYGSVTADYTHYFTPEWFSEIDARGSYGREHYHSDSGTISQTPQWEFDPRLLAGFDYAYAKDSHAKPFIGLGTRYYIDEGKGTVTNTGYLGYERRITQVYLPIGVAYDIPGYGLRWAPKIEFDPLLYGHVNTRLQNLGYLGYQEIDNNQHTGWGWRGELMVGQVNDQGTGWQFGPFFRYWKMSDSDTQTDARNRNWIEPQNDRLQVGASLRFLF